MPYTRINSKWIKDLNVRPETIKLEEKISSKISGVSCSSIFSDISPWARETKNKQMGLHQTKKSLHRKETINKTKRQPTEWENIFTKDTSNKGLVSKIYKQLTQTQHQKNKQSNLKMGKEPK